MSGTIYHIVLYNLKEDVNRDDIIKVTNLFYDCGDYIDGIVDVSVSQNTSPSKYAKGWQLSAILTFENESVLDDLLNHPAHQEISRTVGTGFQNNLIVFDHVKTDERYPDIWENDPLM